MTQSTSIYGKNTDGSYSICKAKPGNEGRYGCHHVEGSHVQLTPNEFQDKQEEYYRKNQSAIGSMKKPGTKPERNDDTLSKQTETKIVKKNLRIDKGDTAHKPIGKIVSIDGVQGDYGEVMAKRGSKYTTLTDEHGNTYRFDISHTIKYEQQVTELTPEAKLAKRRNDYREGFLDKSNLVSSSFHKINAKIADDLDHKRPFSPFDIKKYNEEKTLNEFNQRVMSANKDDQFAGTRQVLEDMSRDYQYDNIHDHDGRLSAEDRYTMANYVDQYDNIRRGLPTPTSEQNAAIRVDLGNALNKAHMDYATARADIQEHGLTEARQARLANAQMGTVYFRNMLDDSDGGSVAETYAHSNWAPESQIVGRRLERADQYSTSPSGQSNNEATIRCEAVLISSILRQTK
jgi:hypothetical protein